MKITLSLNRISKYNISYNDTQIAIQSSKGIPMKRSAVIKLVLISSNLTCLTACEEKQDQQIFNNKEECVKVHDEPTCEMLLKKSLAEHENTAPKFENKEDCEKLYGEGKCTTTSQPHHGSSMFMPMMMGFALGRLMNPVPVQPPRANGGRFGNTGANFRPSPTAPSYPATVQRGGFGKSGSFFSSHGS